MANLERWLKEIIKNCNGQKGKGNLTFISQNGLTSEDIQNHEMCKRSCSLVMKVHSELQYRQVRSFVKLKRSQTNSAVSVSSKLLERCVALHLIDHHNASKLLPDLQLVCRVHLGQ